MNRFIALLLALLIATPSYATGPIIWGPGSQAKALNSGGITLNDYSTLSDTGPINRVKNGSFEDPYVSGWATYDDGAAAAPVNGTGGSPTNAALSQDTTSADLIAGNGVGKMIASSSTQGQGWSYDFSLKAKSSLYSSLVTLSFDYYMSSAATADVMRVYLYDRDNSTLITPQFVTCGGGSTPSLTSTTTTCHAELAWVSTTADDYRLIFHTSSATAITTYVDNIYTGDYKAAVGAALGPWTSYTPTVSNLGAGSTTINTGKYRRSGDSIEVQIAFQKDATPGSGAVEVTWSMPTVCTIDSTAIVGGFNDVNNSYGTAQSYGLLAGSQYDRVLSVVPQSSTTLAVSKPATATRYTGADLGANNRLGIRATLPCAEFAGGTAFGENKVEYAYNSDVTLADDSTHFAIGPAGVQFASYTSNYRKTVRFQSPIQATDRVSLEVFDNYSWMPLENSFAVSASATTGMNYKPATPTTDIDVYFGSAGYPGTAARASGAWSTVGASASYKWRAKKWSSNVVPFGLASATLPGLLSYESFGTTASTFTWNGTGSPGTSASVNLYVQRIGSFVTVGFGAQTVATSGTSSSTFTANTALPTWARPLTAICTGPVPDVRGGAAGAAFGPPGVYSLATTGVITIYRDNISSAVTNSVSAGVGSPFSFTCYVGTGS